MDDVLAFRNRMAESGYEYTPQQAARCVKLAEKFRTGINKQARKDPQHFKRLASLTLQEKKEICKQFAEQGKEVTVAELNGIIDLVLHVYEQEKLY